MTPVQMRMARAAIGWGVRELAEKAGVTANTVTRIENGADAKQSTISALRTALEAAGVIFIAENGEGPGVRLRKQQRRQTSMTTVTLDQAFADGAEAYRRGKIIENCPYDDGDEFGDEWKKGFAEAEEADGMPLYDGDADD